MPETVVCELCGRTVERHASYVVRIEIYADPSMPPLDSSSLATTDFEQLAGELIDQMEGMTSDDLQDDVHRQFEYHVCRPCQRALLANPLGKPRYVRTGRN
jgi:hypothetical protein